MPIEGWAGLGCQVLQKNFKPMRRNHSQIVFGAPDPRMFVSEMKNKHREPKIRGIRSQNAGIVAEKTSWFKHLQKL